MFGNAKIVVENLQYFPSYYDWKTQFCSSHIYTNSFPNETTFIEKSNVMHVNTVQQILIWGLKP